MVKGDLRQEISPEAAALLRIEAAIKGESQKEIASRLIIAGVSSAALAALQGSRKEDKLVKGAAQPDKAGMAEGAEEEDMAIAAQAPGGPDMAALAEGVAQPDKAGMAKMAAQPDRAGMAKGAAQPDRAGMAEGAAQGKRKNLPRLDMEPQLSRVVELWNGEANKSRLKIAKLMEYPKSTAAAAINRLIEKGVLKE